MGVARIAVGQHGLVTRAQLAGLGFSDKAVRHRLGAGRLVRVRSGVYLLAGTPPSPEQAVLAAVLAAGEPAVASHTTAASLWRLRLPSSTTIELTTVIERQLRMPGVVAHRSGTLIERDVTFVGRIPTTTVARTLVDLSSRFDDERLARALDDALRAGVVSLSAVRETITRLPGIAPGRSPSRIHRILSARIPGYAPGDSELETRVWDVIRASGLPLPVRRFRLRGPTRAFVIDLAYPAERIAIEVDGFDPHRTRTAFDADRARQNLLSLLSWLILRFTSRSTDTEIVDTITQALFVRRPAP